MILTTMTDLEVHVQIKSEVKGVIAKALYSSKNLQGARKKQKVNVINVTSKKNNNYKIFSLNGGDEVIIFVNVNQDKNRIYLYHSDMLHVFTAHYLSRFKERLGCVNNLLYEGLLCQGMSLSFDNMHVHSVSENGEEVFEQAGKLGLSQLTMKYYDDLRILVHKTFIDHNSLNETKKKRNNLN